MEYKLFILEEARQHSSRKAAKTHNLDDRLIRRWRKEEPKIKEAYEYQKGSSRVVYKFGSGPRKSNLENTD